jgi:hypothetical protein
MADLGSRPGTAAGVAGAVMIAQAAAARLILRADDAYVYVLGRPIRWACALKSRTGLPCPTCGMTRSLVLSLHGEWARAWRLMPAGPVALAGLLALGAALLALAVVERRGGRKAEARAQGYIRRGALIYAGAAAIVWIAGWAAGFSAALAAR